MDGRRAHDMDVIVTLFNCEYLADPIIQADPQVQQGNNSQNLNRYSYVLNNPAGLTKTINANDMITGIGEGMNAARVALAAVIGGSISELTGGKFANGAVTAAIAQAYNGNSFWDKAKELGSFAVAVGKGFLPGADLMACVANGCGYIDWGLAVADVLASFTPAGQALRLYRAFKAGASPNKLRKMQVVPSTCFVAGTLIHTINGLKPIEEIEVGDLVASKNDQTGETEYKPVVQLFRHEDKTVLNLTFETQEGQEEFIQATPEHPFMLENGQWKNAGYLLPGDTVQTNKNKIVKVKSIATDSQRHKVYNFEVADFHTYFVGETGVWVHNDCGRAMYDVGAHKDLKGTLKGSDSHHVGQKAVMKNLVEVMTKIQLPQY